MLDQTMITVDVPEATVLTLNDRLHWAERAKRTKEIRRRAKIACQGRNPVAGRVTITVNAHYSHGYGVRDSENLSITSKALIDGIRDGGVLADDSTLYVTSVTTLKGQPLRALPAGLVRFTIILDEVAA